MKRLSVILFILCGVAVLTGIWSLAILWQCIATALVLGFAGISFSVAADQRHIRDVERAKSIAGFKVEPGAIQIRTPDRPTQTQAQLKAEIDDIFKGQGGHQ